MKSLISVVNFLNNHWLRLKYYYSLKNTEGERLVRQDEYEGGFGFWDSFNPDNGFVGKAVLGIGQGPLMLATENYRSGLIWETFMSNEHIQQGSKKNWF